MANELDGSNWREFPLFHNVDEEVARRFFATGFRFQYEAETPLLSSNDLGETFFLILSGLAKLTLVNTHQEQISITLFRAGDFFGELAMLEPRPVRSANVTAISPIEVLAVQKKEFLNIMRHYPELALNMARTLGQRLRGMNERMVTLNLPDDIHKVAHTFLLLAKKGKLFNEQGTILMPPLSLKEWSLFCYTSREGLMGSLEQLKKLGALEWQNQRIAITNLEALRRCAEVHQQRLAPTENLSPP